MSTYSQMLNHLIQSTKFISNGVTYYDEGIMHDVFVAMELAISASLDENDAVDFMSEFYDTLRTKAQDDPAFQTALMYSDIMNIDEIYGIQDEVID